ncbi:MAG: 1,3-beta-galactosyl-N-acetylhexosamine phosphorylase [Hungatella sp.]
MEMTKGDFTLPGEAGYEGLTLRLAKKWGADVIRDSDGTKLSEEIIKAGYGIYSTICIIRDHNEWAREHPEHLQQTFLSTPPEMAVSEHVKIDLMEAFFDQQFEINDRKDAKKYWQVYDRTTETLVPAERWEYREGTVTVYGAISWHEYTVSFLAYRIWEEINMYNHVTNHWDKEHLLPLDPSADIVQDYLYGWLENWCKENPDTTVVRFTSLFYNFVWMWGSSERNRNLFSDWGSYDFTVSVEALDAFKREYGYELTAEDFVNQGRYQVSHMPPNQKKRDYMEFINRFVIGFGKKLVDLVHRYGKAAYVFYDDSWVGVEPYLKSFKEFGFDGIIKCIFSGFEVRLCAGVDVPVHEVRLHPYLFPVGLGGAPTFSEGGNPTLDAKRYYISARRAMLQCKIDRIGLGGYLHLVEDFPDFEDYIEKIANEFRMMKQLHKEGSPATLPSRIAVLTAWGSMRSWTLSGHFHETYMHDLIHVNEALAGMPVSVEYISFDDIRNGKLKDVDVLINAGRSGSAWSGGEEWKAEEVVTAIHQWAYEGGTLIGIGEPSAAEGFQTEFRLAAILGVDKDNGARICHGKWSYETDEELAAHWCSGIRDQEKAFDFKPQEGVYLTDGSAKVVSSHMEQNALGEIVKTPIMTLHEFGKGKGVYLSHFDHSVEHARVLLNLLVDTAGEKPGIPVTDNAFCECVYFPKSRRLVLINNSDIQQKTTVTWEGKTYKFTIDPFEMMMEE